MRSLSHLLPVRYLSGNQKRFHQFTLAANHHAGKPFEPFTFGDFWVGITPIRKQTHLFEADGTLSDTEREMFNHCARQFLTANLRHDRYFSP